VLCRKHGGHASQRIVGGVRWEGARTSAANHLVATCQVEGRVLGGAGIMNSTTKYQHLRVSFRRCRNPLSDGRYFCPDFYCCDDPTSIAQEILHSSYELRYTITTRGLRSSSMCEVSKHSSFSLPSLDTDMCGEGLKIRGPAGHRNTLLGWP
jgi:hypothetical protein